MNPQNTTFTFDVCLQGFGTPAKEIIRFQNNISSIFTRVRLLYGATPLEDMINYNVIVRNLTEWTSTNQTSTLDNSSIAQGIGGTVMDLSNTLFSNAAAGAPILAPRNVRSDFIQGIDATLPVIYNTAAYGVIPTNLSPTGAGTIPNQVLMSGATASGGAYTAVDGSFFNAATLGRCTRRYQLNLAFGLFTQGKLIPLKFMASQLAIEWTLANDQECIFVGADTAPNATTQPTYAVGNFNVIPEILEFDASYDAMFLRGLREGGVPIKFSTWHTFIFSTNGATNLNLAIQERSRSVKALFAVQRRAPVSRYTDSHACIFDSSLAATGGGTGNSSLGGTLQTYQYRIGGRYFPAAPVQTSTAIGSNVTNGGCEAWVELEKALNIVGDYRLSPSVNTLRWALPPATAAIANGGVTTCLNELDYLMSVSGFNPLGNPSLYRAQTTLIGNSGLLGSSCYTSAICLETSNGIEISGLNAEEQSDISFLCNWASAQQPTFVIEVYSYFDAMIILRENNVLELIQ